MTEELPLLRPQILFFCRSPLSVIPSESASRGTPALFRLRLSMLPQKTRGLSTRSALAQDDRRGSLGSLFGTSNINSRTLRMNEGADSLHSNNSQTPSAARNLGACIPVLAHVSCAKLFK